MRVIFFVACIPRLSLFAFLMLSHLTLSLNGQTRDLRGQRLILDDNGAGGQSNTLTLQLSNLDSNQVWTFPTSFPPVDGGILSATTSGTTAWTNAPTLTSLTLTDGLTVNDGTVDLSGANVTFPAGSIDLTTDVTGVLPIANGGTNASNATDARTNLGLGTISTQNANSVNITGGTISGIILNAPLTLSGSPAIGSLLTIDDNGGNAPNLLDLQTAASSVLIVENDGETGFGTIAPDHVIHAVNDRNDDERAAMYGEAIEAITDQAIGVWGDANNSGAANTGTIGLLATGNGSATAGETNIALQLNDGEFTMGRTTQTGTGYTVVEGGTGGAAYSAQGPSGVIEIAIPGIVVGLPAVGQSLVNMTITVNNRYASASSIVLVTLQDAPAGLMSVLGGRVVATAFVSNRALGSFNLTFSLHNLSLVPLNIGAGNVTIGYMIVNPSR